MNYKIVTVYNIGYTDGYHHNEGATYALTKVEAERIAGEIHRGHRSVEQGLAIQVDGKTFLLKDEEPICFHGTASHKEKIKLKALSKLTKEEREALGI